MAATLALPLGERAVLEAIRRDAHPLTGDHRDYDALLELVGDARIVLLGEASHGTHEFYRERARITKRLITEHGFTGVAIEGDWPDAYRVNRYVQGAAGDADAEAALGGLSSLPDLDVAQRRRARLRRLAARSQRAPPSRGAQGRLLRPRPLQPRRVDGGGDRLPRSPGPAGGRPRPRSATSACSRMPARAPATARRCCSASASRAGDA